MSIEETRKTRIGINMTEILNCVELVRVFVPMRRSVYEPPLNISYSYSESIYFTFQDFT